MTRSNFLEQEAVKQKWLAGLKKGDLVALFGRFTYPSKAYVERVTPTGRIRLGCGRQFDKEGLQITSDWSRARIEPWTDEIEAKVVNSNLVSKLNSFGATNKFGSLTIDQLRRISAIIDEGKGTENE